MRASHLVVVLVVVTFHALLALQCLCFSTFFALHLRVTPLDNHEQQRPLVFGGYSFIRACQAVTHRPCAQTIQCGHGCTCLLVGFEGNHATPRGAPGGAVPEHLDMLNTPKFAEDVANLDFGNAVWAFAKEELSFQLQVVLGGSASDQDPHFVPAGLQRAFPAKSRANVVANCNAHLVGMFVTAVRPHKTPTACVW